MKTGGVISTLWTGLTVFAGLSVRAEQSAGMSIESLSTQDAELTEANADVEFGRGAVRVILSGIHAIDLVDFSPARVDILSTPRRRRENRSAGDAMMRWEGFADRTIIAAAGGYRGFTDFRSIWLHEYYRQLFERVPGYGAVNPRGWHALGGLRAPYVPGSAYLQGTLLFQGDRVSPGYEPQIFKPLLRGRDRLETRAVRLSTENILSPSHRTLLELGATDTTGREPRFSGQASLNWAASSVLTVRMVVAAVSERPSFHAESAAMTVERDWEGRWFAGLTLRGYRDTGEVVDPLVVSTAAPAMSSTHFAASIRYQGLQAGWRLEAGPYHTHYAATSIASAHFSRLYAGRDWLRIQIAGTWRL